MSEFIVSARKYRPATFASVVGQNHITSTLKNAIERGQLAHAYLFCGPRGVGKTTCARIFAKAINCLNPNGAEACNECESCRSFNDSRSLNIHELDAASNNSVEDIRSLIEQVRIIPQIGRYSVFIIDEVHMLSSAAFNAFLKTLEEPPAHAIFILATTEKHKIIPTILSRCQIYDFNRIKVEDGVEYLKYIASQEKISCDDESLNLIAQKADGGMRDALSMFDKAVSFCGSTLCFKDVAQTLNVLDYDTYFKITELLLSGNYADVLLLFDEILSKGFSGQTFMTGLNRHMRDLLVARNPATTPLLEVTGTLSQRYKTQSDLCPVEFLFGAISILTETDGRIRQSSNQRLLVELGLMKISGLGQKKNSAVGNPSFPLPDLDAEPLRRSQPAQATPIASQSEPENTSQEQPAPAAPAPTPLPQADTASPTPKTVKAQPVDASPQAATPSPETSTPKQRTAKPLISGASIASLMNNTLSDIDDEDDTDDSYPEAGEEFDPDCSIKLENVRAEIIAMMQDKRPRFVPVFEQMSFVGNYIKLAVPTPELKDEILRSRTEILMRIVEMANIKSAIELEITVDEQIKAARPIKLEDRVKYMTEKNPLLIELRKALDLEVE